MGYIVVIEGTDGCGKLTQATKLTERLSGEGFNVIRHSFPSYESMSSAPVKMYLAGEFGDANAMDAYQASILFTTDRLCTYFKDLKNFYEDGGIIILDRYVESNMLHQAGKIKDRLEVDKYLDWLNELEFDTMKLPRANKVLFLDVPVEVSVELAHSRGELKTGAKQDVHEKDPEHLTNAYNSGKYVAGKYGWSVVNCTDNGKMKSIDDISNLIYNEVIEDIKNYVANVK